MALINNPKSLKITINLLKINNRSMINIKVNIFNKNVKLLKIIVRYYNQI